jgi:hypothetical protein
MSMSKIKAYESVDIGVTRIMDIRGRETVNPKPRFAGNHVNHAAMSSDDQNLGSDLTSPGEFGWSSGYC